LIQVIATFSERPGEWGPERPGEWNVQGIFLKLFASPHAEKAIAFHRALRGGQPWGQPLGQPFTYDIFETEGGSDIMNRNIGSERQLEITSTNRIPDDDGTAVSELSRFTRGRRGKAGLRMVELSSNRRFFLSEPLSVVMR
jgi:hypothetical protein